MTWKNVRDCKLGNLFTIALKMLGLTIGDTSILTLKLKLPTAQSSSTNFVHYDHVLIKVIALKFVLGKDGSIF